MIDERVAGGCRGQDTAGLKWTCYAGQAAFGLDIIAQSFLGQYVGNGQAVGWAETESALSPWCPRPSAPGARNLQPPGAAVLKFRPTGSHQRGTLRFSGAVHFPPGGA